MTRYFLLIILALTFMSLNAQITAQWRGPSRTGQYPDKNLLQAWPATGPVVAWNTIGLGKGYSSAVWDGKYFYTTGLKGTQDYLTAINDKGETVWQIPFGPAWTESFPESRCTPTVENGKVYVISGNGTIACVEAESGKINWSFDARKKFNGCFGDWGVCESLLVSGDKVIYTPAGPTTTMVALNKSNGETVWMSESLNDTSAYVSPIMIEWAQKKIIITLINSYLIGVDETNGKILFSYNYGNLKADKSLEIWPGAPKTNTITPLFKDGEIYITGGYNHAGAKFRIAEDASFVELLWTDELLDCHMGGVILHNGFIYGSNWLDNSKGNWCSIDWKTGSKGFETKWFTKGAIIEADNHFYCFEEKSANIALVNPDPAKLDIVSSCKTTLGTGPAWSHPSIYNGLLLIRRGEVLMAFDIRNQ